MVKPNEDKHEPTTTTTTKYHRLPDVDFDDDVEKKGDDEQTKSARPVVTTMTTTIVKKNVVVNDDGGSVLLDKSNNNNQEQKQQRLRKKSSSCCCFCKIFLLIILGSFLITMSFVAYGYYWLGQRVQEHTSTEPIDIPSMDEDDIPTIAQLRLYGDEFVTFFDKILVFQQQQEKQQEKHQERNMMMMIAPPEDLVISADVLNGFIAQDDFARGRLHVEISDDNEVTLITSIPVDYLPGGHNRYLNTRAQLSFYDEIHTLSPSRSEISFSWMTTEDSWDIVLAHLLFEREPMPINDDKNNVFKLFLLDWMIFGHDAPVDRNLDWFEELYRSNDRDDDDNNDDRHHGSRHHHHHHGRHHDSHHSHDHHHHHHHDGGFGYDTDDVLKIMNGIASITTRDGEIIIRAKSSSSSLPSVSSSSIYEVDVQHEVIDAVHPDIEGGFDELIDEDNTNTDGMEMEQDVSSSDDSSDDSSDEKHG